MPALNFFHRLALCDIFIVLDTVQYSPGDWENRNRYAFKGEPRWLSVPVQKAKGKGNIKNCKVDNQKPWAKKQWATIQQTYGKTPFFSKYASFLEATYQKEWTFLSDLNQHLVDFGCQELKIKTQVVRASCLHPQGKGEDLLISLCQQVDAEVYLSGALGRNYIDLNTWKQAKIDLFFHDYHFPEYSRGREPFVPWLFFWDALFFHGSDTRELMFKNNTPITQAIENSRRGQNESCRDSCSSG